MAPTAWQDCANRTGDRDPRLGCFDRWAAQQAAPSVTGELEAGSDCGTFGIRGFRPISLSWIGSDSVNTQPSSPSPGHAADSAVAYIPSETRIQLSVRTKIAQGLLTQQQQLKRDSLWFGYSQQSNWQIFSGDLSRPFRTTDHEPELTYIYPTDGLLPGGWRLAAGGCATAASAWCTSPMASRCRGHVAGTARC